MLILVRPARDTAIGQVQTRMTWFAANRSWTEGIDRRTPVSQVLVGVVLALAVRREAQERQLLVAALQLQGFAAQVQAALRARGKKNSL